MSDLTRFHLSECLPKHDVDVFYDIWNTDETLWRNLSPQHDSQMVMKQLNKDGYETYIATASSYHNVPWKVEWLKEKYPFIPVENIIIISKKFLLNVDVLIDDNLDHLLSGSYVRICMDKPWNRHVNDRENGIYRVLSMTEAREVIHNLNGGN